jgi:hypothetical protein
MINICKNEKSIHGITGYSGTKRRWKANQFLDLTVFVLQYRRCQSTVALQTTTPKQKMVQKTFRKYKVLQRSVGLLKFNLTFRLELIYFQ